MADPSINVVSLEIQSLTMDKLKTVMKKINETFGAQLKLSGCKQDLVLRVRGALTQNYPHDQHRYNIIKRYITEAKYGGEAWPRAEPNYSRLLHPQVLAAGGMYGHNSPYGGGIPPKPPLPPPRFGAGYPNPNISGWHQTNGNGNASGSGSNGLNSGSAPQIDAIPIKFRSSPFYRVEKCLSGIAILNRAAPGDRKVSSCSFGLTESQRALLTASQASPANKQYQVRLFCTHEDYHNPSRSSNAQLPAPVDFPGSCEIKLNDFPVTFSKGIKKQSGSAPPVDLSSVSGEKGTKALRLEGGRVNRVEVVYISTEKKYFVVIYLVEVTTVKAVVDKIKTGKIRAKEEVIKSIITMNADPDVEATALGLSLKDPLTFARIKTPIRSSACNHISCFDAQVFFMMNEQTPAWACPICSKTLKVEDISVDGYFDDILKTCPSSVDAVSVEPDGTWRSSDGKWGTAKPKTNPNTGNNSGANSGANTPKLQESNGSGELDKGKGKATNQEAVLIDSDEEEDEEYPFGRGLDSKPELALGKHVLSVGSSASPEPRSNNNNSNGGVAPVTGGGGGGGGGGKKVSEVIDLTLSDSDDDEEEEEEEPVRNVSDRARAALLEASKKRRREEDDEDEWMNQNRFGVPY